MKSPPKRVLVVAAHPDDEVLGCGGTLWRHHLAGDYVKVVFCSDGESARSNVAHNLIKARKDIAYKACNYLGVSEISFLDFNDNRMDEHCLLDLISRCEQDLLDFEPDLIYTHSNYDLNIDHQLVLRMVMTIFRPGRTRLHSIYSFRIPSSTDLNSLEVGRFNPNHFVDVSEYLEIIEATLDFYSSEMRAFPHSRSVRSVLAGLQYWGSMAGVAAAEPFILQRNIWL